MSFPPIALVVDDEQAVRSFLRECLEDYGFDCVEADDGQKALAALDAQEFDLMLLDVQMPVMDGIELLQKVRARGIRTRIVLLSAMLGYGSVADAIAPASADAYVEKPCTLTTLKAVVDEVCRREE